VLTGHPHDSSSHFPIYLTPTHRFWGIFELAPGISKVYSFWSTSTPKSATLRPACHDSVPCCFAFELLLFWSVSFWKRKKQTHTKPQKLVARSRSGTSDQCCDNNQTHFPMFMLDFHVFSCCIKNVFVNVFKNRKEFRTRACSDEEGSHRKHRRSVTAPSYKFWSSDTVRFATNAKWLESRSSLPISTKSRFAF